MWLRYLGRGQGSGPYRMVQVSHRGGDWTLWILYLIFKREKVLGRADYPLSKIHPLLENG